MSAFFLFLFFIFFLIWLSRNSNDSREKNYTRSNNRNLNIKEGQKIKSENNIRWNTYKEEPLNNKMHGHRCYVDELTEYEYLLVQHLAEHLNPKDYYIFNNITIPSSVTATTQIDHIVVSKYGIFVIENKDYSGWIFGHKNQKKWTQVLKGGKKFHFQNPLLQNFAHVFALKEHMPFLKKSFYNVIVFSNASTFKTEMPPQVMHGEDLVNYIESKDREIIIEGELLMTIGKLSMLCQTQITSEQHVENLEAVHAEKELTPAFH